MKNILIFLCIISSLSFYKSPLYVKLASKLTSAFAKELYKEKQLVLVGYGGRLMKDVKELDLTFTYVKAVTVEEARELFVEVAEEYLKRINTHEKLRPFLHNFPFTIQNLQLSIVFDDERGNFQTNLAHVFYCEKTGTLVYNAFDPEKDELYTIHEEPYEEAKELVKRTDRLLR